MTEITAVTYHYVREIKNSQYPNLKGLEFKKFKNQLDFFTKNYNFVDPGELNNHYKFNKNSCLLTFDDGFKDHIDYVLPELKKRKIKAVFFPSALPIEKKTVLNTHLLHFILEKTQDFKKLNIELFQILKKNDFTESEIQNLWEENNYRNNFDNREVSFFKRLLQKILPSNLRNEITKKLFEEKCGKSLKSFSNELYMSKENLIEMINEGMTIGSHSYNHDWLNTLNKEEQNKELDLSIKFLENLGLKLNNWIMCYPYGAYNDDTISLLKSKKCSFAFTTKEGEANLLEEPYELKRKDTNVFPC